VFACVCLSACVSNPLRLLGYRTSHSRLCVCVKVFVCVHLSVSVSDPLS